MNINDLLNTNNLNDIYKPQIKVETLILKKLLLKFKPRPNNI